MQNSDSEQSRSRQTAERVMRGVVLIVSLAAIGVSIWSVANYATRTASSQQTASGGPGSAHFPPQPADFDLQDATVDRREILSGGPAKDGIPALTNPAFEQAADAAHMRPDDRVIGVVQGEDVRAYPLPILNHHEVVNDTIGGTPVVVTYCPLCDSAAVFDRRTPLGARDFGVSGLLYNSNVLMYDRGGRPESLWSQVQAGGISGPAADKSLAALPLELTTWQDWSTRHPQTMVLSDDTGYQRDYRANPYQNYFDNPDLMFPVNAVNRELPAKARVLGVWVGDAARAYPESAFSTEHRQVDERLDGRRFTIEFHPESRSLRVVRADDGVRWMYCFWFAWHAFHPQTTIYAR